MLCSSQLILLFLKRYLPLFFFGLALQDDQQGKDEQNAISIQLSIICLEVWHLRGYEFIERRWLL